MRISIFFHPLSMYSEHSRIEHSLPVISKHTGSLYHCTVVAYKLPCGRTIWVVSCASAFLRGAPYTLYDAIFQSANSLYNSLSEGGFDFRLNMSRKDFYNVLGVNYRAGYNRPSCK